ncbi:MAG TPA: hypothetical protein D7I15_04965 [Candidatus Poseidoniales archaeon]|nr:MAG TPA: hypothetical protein D7I15_04965 [Candidatus Poseidoniales archaeon]
MRSNGHEASFVAKAGTGLNQFSIQSPRDDVWRLAFIHCHHGNDIVCFRHRVAFKVDCGGNGVRLLNWLDYILGGADAS